MEWWIINIVLVGSLFQAACGLVMAQDQLVSDLLHQYDCDAAPLLNHMTPVVVEVDFVMQALHEIDERMQAVSLHLWVGAIWSDARLAWDPARYNNISTLVLHGMRIWTPDLVIRNSLTGMYENLQNDKFRAMVSDNGLVQYWTGGPTSVSCSLDLTYFPFDTQACYVHVNSWSYVTSTVQLRAVQGGIQELVGSNSQWNVLATNASTWGETFNTGNAFDSVIYKMLFQRKPAYYTRTIMYPCVLLSLLSLFMFLIPISVGDRISYGITVLLSFTVFQMMIADSLPRTSDHHPYITCYLTAVMVLTATCIVFSVFVLNIQCQAENKPLPKWFVIVTFNVLSRHSCSRGVDFDTNNQNIQAAYEFQDNGKRSNNSLTSSPEPAKYDWKTAAAVWDRFFFILFTLTLTATAVCLLRIWPYIFYVPKGLDDIVMIS